MSNLLNTEKELNNSKLENNSLLDLTSLKTEDIFKFYDKYHLFKPEFFTDETKALFLEVQGYITSQNVLKDSLHKVIAVPRTESKPSRQVQLENFCEKFKGRYDSNNFTTFGFKDACTFAMWTNLKNTTESLHTFAQSSSSYINTLTSTNVFNDKIDRNLFINLCLHTLFNEQRTNAQKTLMYEHDNHLLTQLFTETLKPEYLERFGKSAHRQLIENITISCKTPIEFYTTKNFKEGYLAYCLEHSDFLITLPSEIKQQYNTTDAILSSPIAFMQDMKNYEKFLLTPKSNTEIKNTSFAPSNYNKEHISSEAYECYFLSCFLNSGYLYTNKQHNLSKNPNFVLDDNLKLNLFSNLPSFIKTLAYQAYYDDKLLEKIFDSIPNTDMVFKDKTELYEDLNGVPYSKNAYNILKDYVLNSIRNDLIFDQGFSRRDVVNLTKDFQNFTSYRYYDRVKFQGVNNDII